MRIIMRSSVLFCSLLVFFVQTSCAKKDTEEAVAPVRPLGDLPSAPAAPVAPSAPFSEDSEDMPSSSGVVEKKKSRNSSKKVPAKKRR